MSVFLASGSQGGSGGTQIANAVRFDGANDSVSHIPGTAGNRQEFTILILFKRGKTGVDQKLFSAYGSASDTGRFDVRLNASDQLQIDGDATTWRVSSKVFRDLTSWYAITVAAKTTDDTAGNRLRVYDGLDEITAWGTNNAVSLNHQFAVNDTVSHYFGRQGFSAAGYFNGYMTRLVIVDGAQLDPTTFIEADAAAGMWKPKAISGVTWGTNGFHVDFADTADLGNDVSGNNNDWTLNSLSPADAVTDTPTNNFATLNPLDNDDFTVSNGACTATTSVAGYANIRSTISLPDDKIYVEFKIDAQSGSDRHFIGVMATSRKISDSVYNAGSTPSNVWMLHIANGQKSNNGAGTSYGSAIASGGSGAIAIDKTSGKIWWGSLSGSTVTWFGGGDPAAGTGAAFTNLSGELAIFLGHDSGASATYTATLNCGQTAFAATPPTGFKALCTANLPTPSIKDPGLQMDALTYTGNGTTQAITGLGFQPDFVWIKQRNTARSHVLADVVRGANKSLSPDHTGAEETNQANGYVSSLDGSGFTVTAGGTSALNVNQSGGAYVAWCWKAGGAAVTNTDGTITSQVSANPTAGFSVVTYTGNGNSSASFGHGLGDAPKLVIVKSRGESRDWAVYHAGLMSAAYALYLNSTSGQFANQAFNNTATTSAVVNIHWDTGVNDTNKSGNTYVAYCWAEIPGFSKFGSYTGNGSADGPYVHCGFRPKWLLVKRTDSGSVENWHLIDTERNPYNVATLGLLPNTSGVEAAHWVIDVDTNGFKFRLATGGQNASGGTYIFAAFAEYPFGGQNTTPGKAR